MMKLEKLEKYVKETTDLVIEPYEHGLVVTGSFGEFNISLTIHGGGQTMVHILVTEVFT